MRHKRITFISLAILLVLGAAGLSRPGKTAINRMLTTPGPTKPRPAASAVASATPSPSPQPGPDIEQRARAAHGWTAAIQDSIVTGSINFYNRAGGITRQGAIKILRNYPDMVRVEIASGGVTEIFGFDHIAPWHSQESTLTPGQQRDIRAWTRFAPERLFATRDAGHQYSETRPLQEDHRPPSPGRPAQDFSDPIVFNRPVVADQTGDSLAASNPGDQRNLIYLVNAADNIINAASWLEPDDPATRVGDRTADYQAVRVDYSAWRRVNGVLWPFEITHWLGGKVDFRIAVTQVQLNQHPPGTVFQKP